MKQGTRAKTRVLLGSASILGTLSLFGVFGWGLWGTQVYSQTSPGPVPATRAPKSAPVAPAAAAPGMKAYLDEGGNLTESLPAEKAEPQVPEDISSQFTVVRHKNGMEELNFNGVRLTQMKATIAPDGSLQYNCDAPLDDGHHHADAGVTHTEDN